MKKKKSGGKNKSRKKIIIISVVLLLVAILTPFVCYEIVEKKAANRVFDNVKDVPYNEVGMVLGTGPTTKNGYRNLYFYNRVDATVQLYKAKKIKFVLISGDNGRKDYSEPDVMRKELINRGIPKEVIYIDYAGFRTLDSVVRAKEIFGQKKMTVISQKFHNERSIVLGDWQDMELVGFNAKETNLKRSKFKTFIRERGARVKLFLDMLVNKQPKFLGEKIEIGVGKPQTGLNK